MKNCCSFKLLLGIILGIIIAFGGLCVAIAIGSAINQITFGDQIVEWFGKISLFPTRNISYNFKI